MSPETVLNIVVYTPIRLSEIKPRNMITEFMPAKRVAKFFERKILKCMTNGPVRQIIFAVVG